MAKVRLGFYLVEKAKIRYGWGFNIFRMLKQGTAQVRLGFYVVQKAKIRYGWGFNVFRMLK